MELIMQPIHYTQEGKSISGRFYVDEDHTLQEGGEEIGRVIQGESRVRVEDVRPVESYIRMTGKVSFCVLYMTDSVDPRPAVIRGEIPFEEMVYAEEPGEGNCFIRNLRTETGVTVVNPRKLALRILVEYEVCREQIRDEETTIGVESEGQVCRKMKKVRFLKLAVSSQDTYRIKEALSLPGTRESIGQILLTSPECRKLDIRVGTDELYIRGEILVFCLYMSREGRLDWTVQEAPFEGRIPCEGAREGMYCHVRRTLEDTVVDVRPDEDGELRVLGIEAVLAFRMNLYEEEELELLEDLYSLEQECVPVIRGAVYEELVMQNQSRCRLTERLSLPELKENVLQVIYSSGSIQTDQIRNTSDGIHVEGVLHLSFLYLRSDDGEPLGSWQGMVPFSYLIECPGMPEDVVSSMAFHVEQLAVTLAGSEAVEVKAVLAFDVFLRRKIPMDVITEVQTRPLDMERLAARPGIVGHFVQEGEDLWSLAKQYMTTREGIIKRNNLEGEKLKSGDKLLIFKENVGIL